MVRALGTTSLPLDSHRSIKHLMFKDLSRSTKEQYDFGNYAAFAILAGIPTVVTCLAIASGTISIRPDDDEIPWWLLGVNT
jgi:hypothetical protein